MEIAFIVVIGLYIAVMLVYIHAIRRATDQRLQALEDRIHAEHQISTNFLFAIQERLERLEHEYFQRTGKYAWNIEVNLSDYATGQKPIQRQEVSK